MSEYRICTSCVMDSSTAGITFDADGVCNYCREFTARREAETARIRDRVVHRDQFLASVRAHGKTREYDCVVGVSGGLDSSYALYLAVKNGLRPLAVHLDNGWNTELASHNIAHLVRGLGVDLYTHVIEWEENRDLQLSFFSADVVDIEMLMDNAMLALNYQQAARHGVQHILSGANSATEGMQMPPNWVHYKRDVRNIRAIHRKFGRQQIKTHPLLSTLGHLWYEYVRRIRWIPFLDYFPYVKAEALAVLQREVGYKAYPYKHYESVFTRFYQAYILPRKFGYDKRRVHLSTLIASGQMLRRAALEMLTTPPYSDPKQEEQDRVFVQKKLGFSEREFEDYLRRPAVPHASYGSELGLYRTLVSLERFGSRWRVSSS
jgi:N-acetyl sugar amidotransferase